ncbi:MAG: hypothetical protein P4L41_11005 [Flavipsychrobacter sp.]|nr:hypothetical protein [Flavipsychrobacter sp.]
MSELNDIGQPNRGNRKDGLPEERLIAYLEGKLTPAEQHEVEQWLAMEGMEGDALEGLQNIPAVEARTTVNRLNHQLQNTINYKKRKRRQIADNKWAWMAIIVILLLAVLGYLVIKIAVKL